MCNYRCSEWAWVGSSWRAEYSIARMPPWHKAHKHCCNLTHSLRLLTSPKYTVSRERSGNRNVRSCTKTKWGVVKCSRKFSCCVLLQNKIWAVGGELPPSSFPAARTWWPRHRSLVIHACHPLSPQNLKNPPLPTFLSFGKWSITEEGYITVLSQKTNQHNLLWVRIS